MKYGNLLRATWGRSYLFQEAFPNTLSLILLINDSFHLESLALANVKEEAG